MTLRLYSSKRSCYELGYLLPNTTLSTRDKKTKHNHIIRRPDTPELHSRPMTICSFSRSRDRRGRRLQRHWTSLLKPMTRAPPPTPLLYLALLRRIIRLPPSFPSSVLSANQKENPNLTVEISSSTCPPRKLPSTGITISRGGGGDASYPVVSSSSCSFLFPCSAA